MPYAPRPIFCTISYFRNCGANGGKSQRVRAFCDGERERAGGVAGGGGGVGQSDRRFAHHVCINILAHCPSVGGRATANRFVGKAGKCVVGRIVAVYPQL